MMPLRPRLFLQCHTPHQHLPNPLLHRHTPLLHLSPQPPVQHHPRSLYESSGSSLYSHPKLIFFISQSPPAPGLSVTAAGGGRHPSLLLVPSLGDLGAPTLPCPRFLLIPSTSSAPPSLSTPLLTRQCPAPQSVTPPPPDTSHLKLCCLNVRGLSSNLCYINHLLDHFSPDVIALSELWLHDYNLHSIHQISSNYKFIVACPPRQEHPRYCTPLLLRGHGGVAIGWHSRIDHLLSPTPIISNHRLIGLSIQTHTSPTHQLSIFSVYLPSRSGCTDSFREVLDELSATMDLLPSLAEVIILGDINADPGCHGGPLSTTPENEQGRILSHYLSQWNFLSMHLHKSPLSSSHTFASEAHGTLSTIDHILCHESLLPIIESAHPLPDHPLNTSDHLPVTATLLLRLHPALIHVPEACGRAPTFTPRNWARSSKQQILSLYTEPLRQPFSNLLRTLPSVSDLSHRPSLIDDHLATLSELLLSTSRHIPSKAFQRFKRPGWGPALKVSKRRCRQSYYLWIRAGKPRDTGHPAWLAYKSAKKQYRSNIRLHKKLSDESFYNSLDLELDSRRFFQAIRNHTSPLPR
ncbi:hypothetical protein GBAR_LOCUS12161, partial [Geodia barretti]